MFSITFIDNPKATPKGYRPNAKITINKHIEYIEIDTSYWKMSDFKKQWLNAITSLLNKERVDCTLFLSMCPIIEPRILEGWVLYVDKNTPSIIHIQNQLIFDDEISSYISEQELLNRVSIREIVGEDGETISEWKITVDDLISWQGALTDS